MVLLWTVLQWTFFFLTFSSTIKKKKWFCPIFTCSSLFGTPIILILDMLLLLFALFLIVLCVVFQVTNYVCYVCRVYCFFLVERIKLLPQLLSSEVSYKGCWRSWASWLTSRMMINICMKNLKIKRGHNIDRKRMDCIRKWLCVHVRVFLYIWLYFIYIYIEWLWIRYDWLGAITVTKTDLLLFQVMFRRT